MKPQRVNRYSSGNVFNIAFTNINDTPSNGKPTRYSFQYLWLLFTSGTEV